MYNITLNDDLLRQTRMSFADDARMDAWLRQQVESLMLDYNARQEVIRARARAAIKAMRDQSEENGNSEMSLEDINREIRKSRMARRVEA